MEQTIRRSGEKVAGSTSPLTKGKEEVRDRERCLDDLYHPKTWPINIYFDAGYRLSNRTDSRKNSATPLFGLNIDNLAKLSSALPYSITQ